MPAKFDHNEAHKNLALITETVQRLNQRRLELALVEEKAAEAIREKQAVQREKVELEQQAGLLKNLLVNLELLRASKEREVSYLMGQANKEELELLNRKNKSSLHESRVQNAKAARKQVDKELREIENNILKKIEAENALEKELKSKWNVISKKERQIENTLQGVIQREAGVSARESELKNERKRLEEKEKWIDGQERRFKRLIKELNLDIKL